ncbi:unnamed protein product, partial [marine sediment metagenome]
MADTTRNIDVILSKLNTLLPQLKLTTDQMKVLKASMEGVGKTFGKDVGAASDQVKTLNSLLAKTTSHIMKSLGGNVRNTLTTQITDLTSQLRAANRELQQLKETAGGGPTAFQRPTGKAGGGLTGQPPATAEDSTATEKADAALVQYDA